MKNGSALAMLAGGGLVVGAIDALYAIVFWVPRGGRPIRIFQSIAAGLLGPAAFEGGASTAALGVALHFFIAFSIVAVYWWIGRRVPLLFRRFLVCGAVYGLGVYLVMNYVVVPLSAAKQGRFLLSWVVWSIIVHVLLIGIPAAFFARVAWMKGKD